LISNFYKSIEIGKDFNRTTEVSVHRIYTPYIFSLMLMTHLIYLRKLDRSATMSRRKVSPMSDIIHKSVNIIIDNCKSVFTTKYWYCKICHGGNIV